MEAAKKIVIKGLVLSLLTGYIFMALTYLFFLPKYHSGTLQVPFVSNVTQLSHHTANNPKVLLHRIFKSVDENKRNLFMVSLITAVIISLTFTTGKLSGFIKPDNYLRVAGCTNPYFRPGFCALRI